MTDTNPKDTVQGEVLDSKVTPKRKLPLPSKRTLIHMGVGAAAAVATLRFISNSRAKEEGYQEAKVEDIVADVSTDPTV